MAFLGKDLSGTPAELGFEPVPKGQYLAHIVESKQDETKNRDFVIKFTWLVLEGEYEGRKLFDQIMLTGSDKAVAFGERKLKTMAVAMGHPNPNFIEDSEELHGLPCTIVVGLRTWEGEERNEIRDYKAFDPNKPAPVAPAAAPPAQHSAPPAQAPPAATAPASPPHGTVATPPPRSTSGTPPPSQAGTTSSKAGTAAKTPPPPPPGRSPFDPPAQGTQVA